ncbi:cryptochrome/photolyase family protein [Streptomyces aurantiogriseus]|uniref:Deoxyribodipyrimidine photo-lyase n=1 Tax=Streptomyces aurantiogriseus TaxID=66870 RepID=A0A918FKI5_9ACTN|nr:deoxyribodipyrimidine photo-lyase [Streptomyces aurantiogriseus]GGR46211.1 deoxyribodipyrimidine photo-lyase [Streptomyces aurantiogriseus]
MNVSVVLFTSDLRLHDHPPLRAALDAAREVVPLFVRDRAVDGAGFAVPNRLAFLADCLRDLDAGLRERGGRLVVRSGDVVEEVCRVACETAAGEVHLSADVSGYAQRREERLRRTLAAQGVRLHVHEAVTTAVAPGTVTPAASDHFAVFTPYFRHWSRQRLRDALGAPRTVRVPDGVGSAGLPSHRGVSVGLASGGETEGRRRLSAWLRGGIADYADRHDDLAGDATSRLSPHLHFGTLSPVELVHRARATGGPGAEAFVRQLAWRDFHRQVLAARPDAAYADYRTRHDRWRTEDTAREEVEAWREGRTGYPVVDAAMRQLRHEGWMHNRGRLLTASFLAKTLYIDWRVGARHFLQLLVDGDVANNQLNWQWVAGTGTDTRPNRVLNPVAQAKRYDPDGAYVRRWVPELAGIEGPVVHEPWKLRGRDRAAVGYPEPVVDLSVGLGRFRRARGLG